MKQIDRSKLIFKLSLVLCLASAMTICADIVYYMKQETERTENAKSNGKQEAVRAKNEIEKRLRQLQVAADSIAGDLNSGKLKEEQLLGRLARDLEKNSEFSEMGAAYIPFAFNPKERLYAPFYKRENGQIKLDRIENYYDYAQPIKNNQWYFNALAKGSFWIEPAFDKSSNTVVAEYHKVFTRNDPQTKEKKPTGLIYANYSLERLNELFDSLDLGKSGYGILLSKQGKLLIHPNRDYTKNQRSIFDLANQVKSQQLRYIGEQAIQGKSFTVDFTQPSTGQPAWVFIEPIPLTGWSLLVVIVKEDSAVDQRFIRQQLIRIALETIAFLWFISILIFRAYRGNLKSLWAVSVSLSLYCIGGIGFIWYLVWSENNYKNTPNLLLGNPAVETFLEQQVKLAEQSNQKQPIISIPTGVFIETLKFTSSSDVYMTGYIWQKYYNGVHNGVERGVILPEGAEDLEIKEATRKKIKDYELIGWEFKGNVRQTFDFSKYPFDYNDIWLRIWPQDFLHKDKKSLIVAKPDFNGYELLNPLSKPGLLDKIASENWLIESSFFQYQFTNFNTNFGDVDAGELKNYPELYFTIILKRGLVGILIARIIPLSVVAILLFILLLLSRDSSMEVLGACGGLIFILIVDQIGLRGEIAASGIVYLEYIYFILYLLILLVVVNAILYNGEQKFSSIEYKNNLLPKILYWPGLLGVLLILTAVAFY